MQSPRYPFLKCTLSKYHIDRLEIPRCFRFGDLWIRILDPVHNLSISIPTIRIRSLLLRTPIIVLLSIPLLHCHVEFRLLRSIMLRPNRRQEIDGKAPHVESVDERNDPFADCGAIVVISIGEHSECDRKADFDEDEGEFDPEGDSEDTVLAVVDS